MYILLTIALIIYVVTISNRVKRLEEQIGQRPIVSEPQQSADVQQQPQQIQQMAETDPSYINAPLPVESLGPGASDRFIEWVKEDFLVKVGALLLIIAFGWFVSYAFANNWIGEMGRIVLGLLAGVITLIVGARRINNYLHQGGIFLVLGSTVVLLTIWAAREIYSFFTPSVALLAMFLSVAFVGLQAYIHNSRNLAVASLILASIAPLFTNSPNPEFAGLFTYLLLIVLSTIWIVFVRGWDILAPISLLIVGMYSAPFAIDLMGYSSQTSPKVAIGFAFLFTAVFYVSNVVSVLYTKTGEISKAHLITGFGTGLFLTGWVFSAMADNWMSLTLAAWSLVFGVAAFILYRYSNRPEPFYIYGGVGVALIGIATALELDGATLTIALTLESTFLIITSVMLALRSRVSQSLCLTLLVPGAFMFYHLEEYVRGDVVIDSNFFAMFVYIVALSAIAFIFRMNAKQYADEVYAGIATTLGVISSFLGLGLLWFVFHEAIDSYDVATTVSLLTYTIVGISAYVYGRFNQIRVAEIVGAIIIGFVIGRLLLVEVWNMALSGRIITFFLIGILLTSTAFMRKSSKQKDI